MKKIYKKKQTMTKFDKNGKFTTTNDKIKIQNVLNPYIYKVSGNKFTKKKKKKKEVNKEAT